MPATEIGLADVEERLRCLRRRFNTITAVHAASLCMATVLFAGALRVAAGPQRFVGPLPWVTLAACLGSLLWALAYTRLNWLSAAQTARLADRQAELRDRVTTLFELGPVAGHNRLLPLLLMQTLDLGERWQPQRLLPRPYPKSVYLAALSLLSLLASPLIEPALPPVAPPPSPPSALADAASEPAAGGEATDPQSEQIATVSNAGNEDDGAEGAEGQPGEAQKPRDAGSTSAKNGGREFKGKPTGKQLPDGAKASAMLAALPESMRRELQGARSEGDGEEGRAPGSGPQGDGEDDDRKGEGSTKAPNPGLGHSTQPDESKEKNNQKGQELAAANAATAPANAKAMSKDSSQDAHESNQEGSSPGAGAGSQAATLLTVRGGDADSSAAATGTFKLTLSSFLNAVEDKHSPKSRDQKRAPAASATDAQVARPIHEQQKDDDVLRRAAIPPEYEEILKRVYTRAQRP